MPNDLPSNLYSIEQVRQAEIKACLGNDNGLFTLVERAGQAAFDIIFPQCEPSSTVCVLIGTGNNGADGLVVARKLIEHDISVSVMMLNEASKSLEHEQALNKFEQLGLKSNSIKLDELSQYSIIIDALLGTGLSRELNEECIELINIVNQSSAHIISLDTPSGINADTGTANVAIEAKQTIVFGAMKVGLCTYQSRHYCGELIFADIGLEEYLTKTNKERIDCDMLHQVMEKRPRHSHKGDSGKVAVIGGDTGMPGAITLCAEACYRTGSGLVAVISRPEHQAVVVVSRPELLFCGAEFIDMDVYHRLGWADVLVLGPGMGCQDWGMSLFKATLMSDKPIVVDADGLNILSKHPQKNNNWVLTPHTGEAARLLECKVEDVNQNRFEAAKQLHEKYGGVIVLKGAGTIITDGEHIYVATVGNPGLASGGCGDVLAGVIGALIAQGLPLFKAAAIGVVVHGCAGDRAAKNSGERGMLASDLMSEIRKVVNL